MRCSGHEEQAESVNVGTLKNTMNLQNWAINTRIVKGPAAASTMDSDKQTIIGFVTEHS